jgi:hypothetical protein
MPKPWAEVASSPQYQSLNSDQQNAARQQYFSQVVAPQLSTPNDVAAARSQFEQQNGKTRPDFSDVQGSVGPTVAAQSPRSGLTNFADALQHHLMNAPIGIAQLASHGVNAGIQAVAGGTDYAKGVQSRLDAQDQSIQQREADYQQRTPDGAASYGGAAVGEVAPWMTGMGEARALGLLPKIEAAGKIALLKKGGLLAAEGGAMGAAQPVTGEGGYAGQKAMQVGTGAVAAPMLAGGVAIGGKVSSLGRYLTDSGRDAIANERLAGLFGDSTSTLDRLRNNSGIPGFQHTADQAIGTPEAVAAGRTMRNGAAGAKFAERESANNLALRQNAERLGGSDSDLEAAKLARSDGPGRFWKDNLALGAEDGRYSRAQTPLTDLLNAGGRRSAAEHQSLTDARMILGQVHRGTLDQAEASKQLANIQVTTRAGQKAMDQVHGILNKGMVNPSRIIAELERNAKSGNTVVSGAAEDALKTISKNQDGEGWVHVRALDDIRQNIGSMLAKNAPNGAAGSAEGAVYGPLKAKIANQIDRAVPGYRNSLAAYASHSQPINDMQAFRTLLGAIDSGGRDAGSNQAVTLNHLKNLLSKDNKANFPMSPAASEQANVMLEAIQQRSVSSNPIAAPGNSSTTADMSRALGSGIRARAPQIAAAVFGQQALGTWPTLALYLAGEGGAALNRNVVGRMGAKAAESNTTADAIEAYRRSLLQKQSGRTGKLASLLLPYQH